MRDEHTTSKPLPLFALVTAAGSAALAWEVLFRHALSLALGVSAGATALTLAVTMGGMTTGALVAGRIVARLVERGDALRPLFVYGALEATIGLSSLLVAPLVEIAMRVDTAVARGAPSFAPLASVVLFAAPLVVPTIAMGATVPVLALLAKSERTSLSLLYGANTLGAAAGTLGVAFVALPLLGVRGATVAVVCIDFAVAALALTLARGRAAHHTDDDGARAREASSSDGGARRRGKARVHAHATTERATPSADAHGGVPSPSAFATALLVAFTTGFATFVVEVAGFRGLIASLWSTTEAFALLLFAVLLAIALAAPLARSVARRMSLPATLGLAGALVVVATPLIARFESLMRFPDGYFARMTTWGALSFAVLGVPILALGLALPRLLDEHVASARAVGRLYAINTLGAVTGALGAAWLLLPAFGYVRALIGAGAATIVVALVVARPALRLPLVVTLLVSLGAAFALDDGAGRTRAPGRIASTTPHTLLAIKEGPDVTTAVIERRDKSRALLIDGFAATEESSPAHYMAWMGHLPMMLHEAPTRALVICFGTGQTAHAVRLENPRTLDVVDVNEAVFDMASHFRTNRGVLTDPRVTTHIMDGRVFLRRTTTQYDVVTLEPMPPTFAGVNSLYSEEFYRLVESRLTDGGILAQWLPFHIVSPSDARAITASFHAVFPDAALWVDPASGTGILVGRKGTRRDLGTELPGATRPDLGRSLPPEMVRRMMFLLPDGVARYAQGAGRVTDDNQRLAYGLDRIDRHTELLGRANKTNLEEVLAIARATRGDVVPSMQ